MSWSDRRAVLAAVGAVAGLAGCGFRPAYGPGGVADDLRGQIAVDAPDSRLGFVLVERLEARLGPAEAPRYRLSYRIDTDDLALGITRRQEITRYNLTGTLDFQLRDIPSGDVVESGRVTAFAAYSATASTVATQASERDAYRRLMVMLADRLVTRLIATAEVRRS